MTTRLQQQRNLEEKLALKEKDLAMLNARIDNAIAEKVGADRIYELAMQRNDLTGSMHFIQKQIDNLRGKKCYLGDPVIEVNEKVY